MYNVGSWNWIVQHNLVITAILASIKQICLRSIVQVNEKDKAKHVIFLSESTS